LALSSDRWRHLPTCIKRHSTPSIHEAPWSSQNYDGEGAGKAIANSQP
jgi:hypothetical protein